MTKILRALPVILLSSLGVARAADLEVETHVDAVTLYPDAALVTRIGEIDAPAGANRLLFRGLPAMLDPDSLRLRAEGEGKAVLGAFDLRDALRPASDNAREQQRKTLNDQREQADIALDASAAELEMIKSYGKAAPADEKSLAPDQWDAAWKNFGAGYVRAAEEQRQARRALADIDAKLRALAYEHAPPPESFKDAAIQINAAAPGKFRVAVSYLIPGASWRPSYEARLDTGEGKAPARLTFERRALLSQNSGEDWSDVALTLTTIRARAANMAPTPAPALVDFAPPPRPVAAARAMDGANMAMRLSGAESLAMAPMERETARLAVHAFQASFVAPGRISLESGAADRSVLLASRNLAPDLSWRVAPALDPRAFLSAAFDNDGEAPVLAGPILLFRDGDLIGRGSLADAAPQARIKLGFGVDEQIRVMRAPVEREQDVSGLIGQSRTDSRDIRTSLRNLHGFPVAIELLDRVPYSENAAIAIDILPRTTPPDEKDVDGKRGVMAWRFALPANDSKAIELAWRVKWPADREIVIPSP